MISEAKEIVRVLQSNGYIAYFAGGCVRDILLKQSPADIDIATSAKPEEIEKLFKNTLSVGKAFGVILVKSENHSFEVASFRVEGPYTDRRRPDFVKFSSEEEDAKRRDFSINGMFLDPIKNKVIDHVGGQEDLKKRVIRFIGNPKERIQEDNLRLIRAIRFKVTLNFQYEQETFDAVSKYSHLIKTVSPERIRDEINKIFLSSRRHIGLTELVQSRLSDYILPEVNELKGVPQPIEYHHEGDVFTHTYLAIKSLSDKASLHLVWAVLLHDIGKPPTLTRIKGKIVFHDHAEVSATMTRRILSRFKFSSVEIKTISYLVENHMKIGQVDKMRPTKKMAFLLDKRFPDLIKLVEADSKGTYPVNLSLVDKLCKELEKAKDEQNRINAKLKRTKLFTGDNLIRLGYTPSSVFKEIIDEVNDRILDGKIKNLKDAETFVQGKYKK